MGDIMKYYHPRSLIVISFFCTIISSSHYPIHGFLFGEALFNLMDITQVHYWRNVNFWNFMLIVLAVVGGGGSFL
jgi:hypothetical protein